MADDIILTIEEDAPLLLDIGESSPSGGDYNEFINKPSIEGHVLIGNSTLPQIGVVDITPQDIDRIIYG